MSELVEVFRASVDALSAETLVLDALARDGGPFLAAPRVRVIGLGSPAGAMACGAARIVRALHGRIATLPGASVPGGLHTAASAEELLAQARDAEPGEVVLFLVAGGGLFDVAAPGLSPEAHAEAKRLLRSSPLSATERRTVRTHLSAFSGGRLAAACRASVRRVLVVSDVVGGEDPALVADGPCSPDPSTFRDALEALNRHRLTLPEEAMAVLEAGRRKRLPETPKPGDPVFAGLEVERLAGPETLAAEAARQLGVRARKTVAWKPQQGEIERLARRIAGEAWQLEPGTVGIASVEPELKLETPPEVPRARHLALLLARELQGLPFQVLVAGSGGSDTDPAFAGAWADGKSWAKAEAMKLSPARRIAAFEAAPVFQKLQTPVPGFISSTRLADLVLVARQGL